MNAKAKGTRSSKLEAALASQMEGAGLPVPQREFRFAPPRRWRFDFAWPLLCVAAECEGGVWVVGRHTRGAGFARDAEKYNEAALRGWLVLRFTAGMIRDGTAIAAVGRALDWKEATNP